MERERIQREVKLLSKFISPERLKRIENVLKRRTTNLTVVMDRFVDVHNMSAVMRTSEGMGLRDIHVIQSDFLKNYAAKSVTKHSDKWLDINYYKNAYEVLGPLKEKGYKVWTAHLSSHSEDIHDLEVPEKVALVLGSEKDGPGEDSREMTDKFIYLPIQGFIESYNVSVATALLLQLLMEKRSFEFISGDEYVYTKHRYYYQSVKFAGRFLDHYWKNNRENIFPI